MLLRVRVQSVKRLRRVTATAPATLAPAPVRSPLSACCLDVVLGKIRPLPANRSSRPRALFPLCVPLSGAGICTSTASNSFSGTSCNTCSTNVRTHRVRSVSACLSVCLPARSQYLTPCVCFLCMLLRAELRTVLQVRTTFSSCCLTCTFERQAQVLIHRALCAPLHCTAATRRARTVWPRRRAAAAATAPVRLAFHPFPPPASQQAFSHVNRVFLACCSDGRL